MTPQPLSRDELATRYFDQLPFTPYPIQEEALLAWFSADQGVLVCTPTGTGKTLIAEAALFEALHTGSMAYYTTPLIALTEQKFREMQNGGRALGLPSPRRGPGDRQSPREPRGPHPGGGGRDPPEPPAAHARPSTSADVSAVVMDEFHSFADPERGVVWELALGLLPPQRPHAAAFGHRGQRHGVHRTGSARPTNAAWNWSRATSGKVPLSYQWVPDKLLDRADRGDGRRRRPKSGGRRPWSSASTATSAGRVGRADQGQADARRRPAGPVGQAN